MILLILLTCAISYLLGSFNFAIICSILFRKEDVREKGSGNAGMTNYARNYGAGKSFLLVIVGDMGKCILAVFLTRWLFRDVEIGGHNIADLMKFLAGLFVMLGHILPIFFNFKGGKGVLTVGALLLAFDWRVFLIAIIIFFIIAFVSRYVSLASIIGVFVPIPLFLVFYRGDPLVWLYIASQTLIWLIVVFSHRDNIKRLLSGIETRFAFGNKNSK